MRLGPFPSLPEQGGADIVYCPDYRPQLRPELTLGEMCGDTLLTSPLLAQGEGSHNPFRVIFREVRRMENNPRELVQKVLISGASYWQRRDSPGAVDTAVAALVSDEHTALGNLLINITVPRLLRVLPQEISGLPPAPELGPAYDIRVATRGTYNCIEDTETLLKRAAQRGLSGIAITDLDHMDGVKKAQQIAEGLKAEGLLPRNFLVIPGEEVHTLSGPVIGLFLTDRVQRGMTVKATVDEIHRQGGVAILCDPGTGSGPKFVYTLDVDGYLLRSHPASLLRTLQLLRTSEAGAKPVLSGSGCKAEGAVGIPYTVVETSDRSLESIRHALRERRAFGATNIQMPLLGALLFRPFVAYERTMALYFRARDRLEIAVARLICSDNVEIRTTYDKTVAELLGVVGAPATIARILDGSSALSRAPKMVRISADYGPLRVEYTWDDHTVRLLGAIVW